MATGVRTHWGTMPVFIVLLGGTAASGQNFSIAYPQIQDMLPPFLRTAGGCGGCPLPIERVMRDFQARNEFVKGKGNHEEWPDAECGEDEHAGGKKKAPPYPPDGFYGDLCDPRKGADLVQSILDRMRAQNPEWYGRYIKEDPSGPPPAAITKWSQPEILAGLEPPFQVTAFNYCETLNTIWSRLQQLQWLDLGNPNLGWPGGGGTVTSTGHYCTGGYYCAPGPCGDCFTTCAGVIAAARALIGRQPCPLVSSTNCTPGCEILGGAVPFTDLGVAIVGGDCVASCINPPGLQLQTGVEFNVGVSRAGVNTGPQRGRGHVFLSVNPLNAQSVADGIDDDPPTTNAIPEQYGSFNGPADWSRLIQGFWSPNKWSTGQTNIVQWDVPSEPVMVLRPRLDREDDTSVQAGCSACTVGRVDSTLDGVNVKIDLGTWQLGSAGYLLIRGDTLAGSGEERVKANTSGQMVLGTGAAEMGNYFSPVARTPTAAGFELITSSPSCPNDLYRQVRVPHALIEIRNTLTAGQYTITFYMPPAQYTPNACGGYLTTGLTIFAQVRVTHSMQLDDDPGSSNPDDVLVTGSLLIEEFQGPGLELVRKSLYKEIVPVRNPVITLMDPLNGSIDTQNVRHNDVPIQRGYMPEPVANPSVYAPNRSTWELVTGWTGAVYSRREALESNWETTPRTETRSVYNSAGALVSKERKSFSPSAAKAEELTEYAVYPDGSSSISAAATLVAGSTKITSSIQEITDAAGHWQRFEYDATTGRLAKIITQFKDRSFSEEQNHVVQFAYHWQDLLGTALEPGDNPEFIVERVERLENQEISRTYTIYWFPGALPPSGQYGTSSGYFFREKTVVRCRTLGAPSNLVSFLNDLVLTNPDASDQLVTHTRTNWAPSYMFHETLHSERKEDGSIARYEQYDGTLVNYGFAGEDGTVSASHNGPRDPLSPACPVSQSEPFQKPRDGVRRVTVKSKDGIVVHTASWDMQGTFDDGFGQLSNGVPPYSSPPSWNDLRTAESHVSDRDAFGRPEQIDYLDGTFTKTMYGCCGVEAEWSRDGVKTLYEYDEFKRLKQISTADGTTAELATIYTYDADGRVLTTVRKGVDASEITASISTYDKSGRLLTTKDAYNKETTYGQIIDLVAKRVTQTTTLPDPDDLGPLSSPTEITITYPDGRVLEQSGTAAAPTKFEYGVELDTGVTPNVWVAWTKQIAVGDGGAETEWVRSYTDMLGRGYRTKYADNAEARSFYDNRGRLWKQVDPDGVVTLHAQGRGFADTGPTSSTPAWGAGFPTTGWEGDWQLTVVDITTIPLEKIDFGGADRITRTSRQVLKTGDHGVTDQEVIRSTTTVWTTDNNATATFITSLGDTTTHRHPTNPSLKGEESWSTIGAPTGNPTTHTLTEFDPDVADQTRTETTTNPDSTKSVSLTKFGRLLSITTHPIGGYPAVVHTQVENEYDAHGRTWKIKDFRTASTEDDRITIFAYDNKDRQTQVTSPDPDGPSNPLLAQVTIQAYDNLDRVTQTTLPDSTLVKFEYFPTGAIKKTWGSRTYPTEYTYDTQGRMKTLKTWQQFDPVTGTGTTGTDATTTWNYSTARGWLSSKVYNGGGSNGPAYEYWPSGRLKKRTWTSPRNVFTDYTYNAAGESATINHSDTTPDVTYTYDRRGQLVGVVDGVGTRSILYTNAGQPDVEDFTAGVLDTVRLDNDYDTVLRRQAHKFYTANGSTLQSQVDFTYESTGTEANGRLLTVAKTGGHTAEYEYAPRADTVWKLRHKNGVNQLTEGVRTLDNLDRLKSLLWDSTAGPDESYTYTCNTANQRTRVDLADGSYWVYAYDALGQLTSGKRYWSGGGAVPGQHFEYAFDQIGNRTSAKMGGDEQGLNLRPVTYNPNLLNQYAQRTVSDGVDIMGYFPGSTSVTVNGLLAYHVPAFGFYQKLLSWVNTVTAQYQMVNIVAHPMIGTETRMVFIPKTPEPFTYDADGNLKTDGRWGYTWDADNRLVAMETLQSLPAAVPRRKLVVVYDYMHRRCAKHVYVPNGGGDNLMEQSAGSAGQGLEEEVAGDDDAPPPPTNWVLESTFKYVWDGWNLVAELDGVDAVLRTYAWGLDLSGSEQGAGGIGGLLFQTDNSLGGTPTRHALFDGNGNLMSMRDTAGAIIAGFEYGPFGETLTVRGASNFSTMFRFSTKYADPESGLLYYGHRYYNTSTGRWLSRDWLEEDGGPSLYAIALNATTLRFDPTGLRPIDFAFVAFINGAKRKAHVLKEPFTFSTYGFSTDYRNFGQFNFEAGGAPGNARLYSIGQIETTQIGRDAADAGYRPPVRTGTGITKLYHGTPVGPGYFEMQWEYIKQARAPVKQGFANILTGTCDTRIEIRAEAEYPFPQFYAPQLVPALDYSITFWFQVTEPGKVRVTVFGRHDSFPDYEAYVDGPTTKTYFAPASGPGLINVNGMRQRWYEQFEIDADTPEICNCIMDRDRR